jgi:hypothetical protein
MVWSEGDSSPLPPPHIVQKLIKTMYMYFLLEMTERLTICPICKIKFEKLALTNMTMTIFI